MSTEFSVQKVLELACAAQRTNNEYLKETESIYTTDGKFVCLKHDNKSLIRHALGIEKYANTEQEFRPVDLFLEPQDTELANEIKKYFRKLMFSAVKGDNEFQTEVNALLNADQMPGNKIGFIACLPSVYARDTEKSRLEKALRSCDTGFLGAVDSVILDKDCEILQAKRSNNFDAYNILAIIDNRIVSWFSKAQLKLGPCVVIKGKIKQHGENWYTKNSETRLNYVKVAQ
jgi:hypothetical protein